MLDQLRVRRLELIAISHGGRSLAPELREPIGMFSMQRSRHHLLPVMGVLEQERKAELLTLRPLLHRLLSILDSRQPTIKKGGLFRAVNRRDDQHSPLRHILAHLAGKEPADTEVFFDK